MIRDEMTIQDGNEVVHPDGTRRATGKQRINQSLQREAGVACLH